MTVAGILPTDHVSAQASQDFSFVNSTAFQHTINGVADCRNNVDITVTTTDFSNGNPISHWPGTQYGDNTMLVPFDVNNNGVTAVLVVISFSTPISNPQLLVSDIDYKAVNVLSTNYPHEWLSNLTSGYTITPYSTQPTPVAVPAGTVTPLNMPPPDDSDGACWLGWTGCYDTLRFVYNRVGTQLGLHVHRVDFECECDCKGCTCPTQVNLTSAGTTANEDGRVAAQLEILSGSTAISQVNVSLPWYAMTASAECIDCGAHDISMNGHFIGASPLAGENSTFVGPPGVLHSGEVTYCFGGSAVVNETIDLKMQFPELLDLECCRPDVEYCIKVEVIDEDCRYCEFLFCLPRRERNQLGSPTPPTPGNSHVEKSATGSLLIYPNPTNGKIQAVIPPSHVASTFTIHDKVGKQVMKGAANGTLLNLDVSSLPSGQYIFSLGDKADRLEAEFVLQQ